MFLAQDPKSAGKRLGYKGLHRMVKKLGAISGVEDAKPHRFRHTFGTEVTRRGVDLLFGKELMALRATRCFSVTPRVSLSRLLRRRICRRSGKTKIRGRK